MRASASLLASTEMVLTRDPGINRAPCSACQSTNFGAVATIKRDRSSGPVFVGRHDTVCVPIKRLFLLTNESPSYGSTGLFLNRPLCHATALDALVFPSLDFSSSGPCVRFWQPLIFIVSSFDVG